MGTTQMPEVAPKAERLSMVQSVDRAMSLLELLGAQSRGLRLIEMAKSTGLSSPTIHRLLTTLEQRQFVHFNRENSRWHIGRQTFAVAGAFLRDRSYATAALPYLRRLRDETRETVNLGVVEGQEVVIVRQIGGDNLKGAVAPIGGRVPLSQSGMGKAILAAYDRPLKLDLAIDLETIRRRGYAVDYEEHTIGVRCIASAVLDFGGMPLCAISISGAVPRMTDTRIAAIGPRLAQVARDITLSLGGEDRH